MKLENINTSSTLLNTESTKISQNENKEVEKDNIKDTPAATFEKTDAKKETYGTYNKKEVLRLKMETEKNKESLIKIIQDSLRRQGKNFEIANNMVDQSLLIDIDETARAEAQALISEDGELGVEKTSQRLVDFAIAISNGDTSKAGILRDAIEKGFKEAEKMWGGELPQISKDTYEATMKKFDAWANGTKLEEEK